MQTLKEHRMWIRFGGIAHSGKADLIVVDEKRYKALCIDWKSGRSEITDPRENQQLRDLACLIYHNFAVTEIEVAIVQPFASRQPPCVYDEESLQRATQEMKQRVLMSNNPIAPRIAGEKQCRWCRFAPNCPEHRTWINHALPAITSSGLPTTPWTTEQWQTFLSVAPEAEKWIEERRAEAKRMLAENPDSIPGYTLETRERDTVTNPQGVFNEATAKGVTLDSFMQAIVVSKKGLKAALRSAGFKGRDLDNAIESCLNGNVTTKANEPTIVKAKP